MDTNDCQHELEDAAVRASMIVADDGKVLRRSRFSRVSACRVKRQNTRSQGRSIAPPERAYKLGACTRL